jgi:hypothetical protein
MGLGEIKDQNLKGMHKKMKTFAHEQRCVKVQGAFSKY